YGLISGKSYTGGIESDISTVIAFSSADHWLKNGGKIGVLITWPVFKSGSARGFRIGKLPDGSGLKMENIEDMSAIQPFPDAINETGLYIATKIDTHKDAVFDHIPCRIWQSINSSRIDPNQSLSQVLTQVNIEKGEACPISDFGSPLWTGDMETFKSIQFLRGESPYLESAHRGVIGDMNRVFWVKVEKYAPETNRALIRTLGEDEYPRARVVEPTHGAWIEADLLFPLLRGNEVCRYSYEMTGWHQIIPNSHYRDFESEDEFSEKYPAAYSYFLNYRDLLLARSTFRRYSSQLPFYSVFCVGDYSFSPYKVVWLEQQDPKRFRASVITKACSKDIIPDRVIVPDHKLYFASFDILEEAHYLCACLNSKSVRKWLGGFLPGKQIGTTVLEFLHIPSFDLACAEHRRAARISIDAHEKRGGHKTNIFLSSIMEDELDTLITRIVKRK
ncbi:MAG: hypothetical protein JXA42_22430, partial [Anaerolineales bacterium]|nr:hypothetical protein [Anaerolineales bacterium]